MPVNLGWAIWLGSEADFVMAIEQEILETPEIVRMPIDIEKTALRFVKFEWVNNKYPQGTNELDMMTPHERRQVIERISEILRGKV